MLFLIKGILLGFAAGISPGPLNALLFSESLKGGIKSGLSVAFAPLITDAPIILLSLFLTFKIKNYSFVLGILDFAGAVYLTLLAVENIRIKNNVVFGKPQSKASFKKALIVNLLNPNPYVFWFTIGAPTLLVANEESISFSLYFIGGFYILLIGTKILLALLIAMFNNRIKESGYILAVKFAGAVLLIVAAFYFYNSLSLIAGI